MDDNSFSPARISARFIQVGCKKANASPLRLILLGILGGAFIALASEGSNVAIHTLSSTGLAKALAGALFSAGLMMVVVTGAELFTGNALIVIACLEKQSKWRRLFRNWVFVYLGNFAGSVLVAWFVLRSGQFNFSEHLLGGFTIKMAAYKVGLTFENAFFMGILCNWLVCMAVWMAGGANDVAGKMIAVFFPIWLFITSGFEHSVANMYYIPAGILAKANPDWAAAALKLGATAGMLEGLTWRAFFLNNLVPVTLGNIVGGTVFVGMAWWLAHLYKPGRGRDASESDRIGCQPQSPIRFRR